MLLTQNNDGDPVTPQSEADEITADQVLEYAICIAIAKL